MSQKLIISKAGFDALTETDPNNLIFDSSLNHLKTAISGSVTLSYAGAGTAFGTVAHNFGYLPLAFAYFSNNADPTKWFITSTGKSTERKSSPNMNVDIAVDTSNLIIGAFDTAFVTPTAGTATVQYEIFYEGS